MEGKSKFIYRMCLAALLMAVIAGGICYYKLFYQNDDISENGTFVYKYENREAFIAMAGNEQGYSKAFKTMGDEAKQACQAAKYEAKQVGEETKAAAAQAKCAVKAAAAQAGEAVQEMSSQAGEAVQEMSSQASAAVQDFSRQAGMKARSAIRRAEAAAAKWKA